MAVEKSMAQCVCGETVIELRGPPIYCAACHCDDCQAAAEKMANLHDSAPVMDQYRGTSYVLQRKDRYSIVRGEERLGAFKLREDSPARRMIAGCCNSPMFLAFDNSQHWISLYAQRLGSQAPAVQARIATKFLDGSVDLPTDPPTYRRFPPGMVFQLLKSMVLTAVGR